MFWKSGPWSRRPTGLIVPEMTYNVLSWDVKQPTNQFEQVVSEVFIAAIKHVRCANMLQWKLW